MNENGQPPSKKSSIFSLLTDDKEPSLSESNSSFGIFFQTNQQTSSLTEQSHPTLQTKRSFEGVRIPLLPSISSQLVETSQNLPSSASKRPRNEEDYAQYNVPLSKESVMDVASLLLDLDRRDKLPSTIKHDEHSTSGSLVGNSSSINNNFHGISQHNTPREYFNNITLSTVNTSWVDNTQAVVSNGTDYVVPRRSGSLPTSTTIPQYNLTCVQQATSFSLPTYIQVLPSSPQQATETPTRSSSFPNTSQNNNNNSNSNNNNNHNSGGSDHNYFPGSQAPDSSDEKATSSPQQSRSIKITDGGKESNQFTHTYFDDQWMAHYKELSRFKAIYGHVNVTRTLPEWRSLGNWVAEQRRKMRKGKLSRQQFEMLREIGIPHDIFSKIVGFEWDRSYYFKAAVPSVYATEDSSKTQNNVDC